MFWFVCFLSLIPVCFPLENEKGSQFPEEFVAHVKREAEKSFMLARSWVQGEESESDLNESGEFKPNWKLKSDSEEFGSKLDLNESDSGESELHDSKVESKTDSTKPNVEEPKSDLGESQSETNSNQSEPKLNEFALSLTKLNASESNLGKSNSGESNLKELDLGETELDSDESKSEKKESDSGEMQSNLDESDFMITKFNSGHSRPQLCIGDTELGLEKTELDSDESKSEKKESDLGEMQSNSDESDFMITKFDLGQSQPQLYLGKTELGLGETELDSDESKSEKKESDFEEIQSNLNESDLMLTEFDLSQSNLDESKLNASNSLLVNELNPEGLAASTSHLSLLNQCKKTPLTFVVVNKNFSDAILLLIATIDETCRNLIKRITEFYLDVSPTDTILDVLVYANNLFFERVIAYLTFANALADEVLYGLLEASRNFARRSKDEVALRGSKRFAEDLAEVAVGFLRSRIALGFVSLLLGFLACVDVVEKLLSFLN